MVELFIIVAQLEADYEMERDRRFYERLGKATPEQRILMLEQREKERLERIEERRHREQIRAQEKIAEAIRFSAIMRS